MTKTGIPFSRHDRIARAFGRATRLGFALAALATVTGDAGAQQDQRCWLLEQELAAYDRGGGRADAAEIRRFEAAIARQQATLDKTEEHARRIGCFKRGFLFFRPDKPPECRQIEASLAKMKRNLDELVARRDRLAGPPGSQDPGRQRIVRLLAEYNCGPQYSREAGYSRPRGLFGGLFEEDSGPLQDYRGFGERRLGDTATYRTLCVRTCDGYYFPISFATLPQRFEADAAQCRAQCPTAVVELFVHENPGGAVEQAVSLNGKPYSEMPTAFRYRKEYVKGCSCNPYTLALEEAEQAGEDGARPKVVGPEAAAAPAGKMEGGDAVAATGDSRPADGSTDSSETTTENGVNVFRPGGPVAYPTPRFTTRDPGAENGASIIRIGPRGDAVEPEPDRARSREELPPYLDPLRER